MTLLVAAVGGFLPVLVLVLIIVAVLVARSRHRQHDDAPHTMAVVLDTRSERRHIGPTGLVNYHALVRFHAFDGRTIEAWAPTALPPKKWQVPGQHVVVAYAPDDPWNARVQRLL